MEGQGIKIKMESCPELPADLKTLCRICGNFSLTVVKIFTDQGLCSELGKKMNLYLPVKVQTGDGLPDQCCWECTSSVMSWHKLCLTSKTTEKKLMMYKKVHSALKQPKIESKSCVVKDELEKVKETPVEEEKQVEEEPEVEDFIEFVENDEELENIEEVFIEDQSEVEDSIESVENYEELEKLKEASMEQEKQVEEQLEALETIEFEELDEETYVDLREKPKEHVLVESIEELYNGEQVSCDICHKLFRNQRSFDCHFARVHVQESQGNKIPCPICGVERMEDRMANHIARIHSGKRPFSCKVCDKTFKVESDLRMHVGVHSDSRYFKCKLCPRSYNTPKGLHYHSQTHLKTKPIPCKLCGVIFSRQKTWSVHIRRNHQMTEQQYHNIPPEEVKDLESLIEPRTCKICNITFKYKIWCRAHMRKEHPKKCFLATDKKPFMCDFCGKGFKFKNQLKQHAYIHSEEKPFHCHLCPKHYCSKLALKKHLNKFH